MFCTKCGNEIKPGNKFCVKCGTPVRVPEASAAQGEPQKRTVQPEVKKLSETQTQQKEKNLRETQPQQKEKKPREIQPQQTVSDFHEKEKKQSKNSAAAVLIAVIVVAVFAIGGTIGYLMWNNADSEATFAKEEKTEKRIEDSEKMAEEASEAETEEIVSETEQSENSEAENPAVTVEVDAALVAEAVQAYQAYVQSNTDMAYYGSYVFMNINGDCVPELFYNSGVTAGGLLLLSYFGGTVHENWLPMGDFHYLEYQNKMYLSSGRMDVYSDDIFSLKSGELVPVTSGWYGLEDNSTLFDADGNAIPYVYFWEEEEMTESDYEQKIMENIDLSAETKWIASDTVEHAFFNYSSGVPELKGITLTADIGQDGDILPASSTDYLTESEIQMLSDEELRLARNEIYARHGYIFKDEELQEYFMSKSWYEPTETEVTDTMLNEYEIANRDLIREIEDKRK